MNQYETIVLSLIKNFESIQSKIEVIQSSKEILDVKQISDIERYVGMQASVIDSLATIDRIFMGEK